MKTLEDRSRLTHMAATRGNPIAKPTADTNYLRFKVLTGTASLSWDKYRLLLSFKKQHYDWPRLGELNQIGRTDEG